MTLSPLTPMAPMQTSPVAPVPTLGQPPAPLQPSPMPAIQTQQAAPPAYYQPVASSFQQAHGLLDGISAGMATGRIPAPQGHGFTVHGGSGGGDQGMPDDGAGYDVGPGYLKEGSPFREYNGGEDTGPQTGSPGRSADTQQRQGGEFWQEMPNTSRGDGYDPQMGQVGANGIPLHDPLGLLTPAELAELPGTNYRPTNSSDVQPMRAEAGVYSPPSRSDYSSLGIPLEPGFGGADE